MSKVLTQKTGGRSKVKIDGVGHYGWEESGGGEDAGGYKVLQDADYQVLLTDDTLEVQQPDAPRTITLPVFEDTPLGKSFKFWGFGAFSQGGDTVTIVPHAGDEQVIAGRASTSFSNNDQKIEVVRGSGQWLAVISERIPVAG